MLPAFVLVSMGKCRRFWIPVPTFLLWPLWLLAWVVWLLMRLLHLPGRRQLWLALVLSGRLSGLRMEIESNAGPHIQLRMI